MFLSNLRLVDFRNFKELEVSFSSGINIFYGDNAQGKTNLLESIFYLSNLRSEKSAKDQQLIMHNKPMAYVKGVFDTRSGPVEREIILYTDRKKVVKEGGYQKNRWSELCEDISAVFFSPDDLLLIKGSPSIRRKYLDYLIYQLKPGYIRNLQAYYRIISQRNVLLKSLKKNPSLSDSIEPWDLQLCDAGSRILAERLNYIEVIDKYVHELFDSFCGGSPELNVKYFSSVRIGTRETIKRDFLIALKHAREKEISRAFTLNGPHRDDILFFLDGHDARFFGSQGQQRILALCLKMAQAGILANEKGESPILLLDDVMSELDFAKRRLILENNDSQVFITTADLNFIPDEILSRSNVYRVISGSLEW
ncbi:MAG: DNA replication/repair protein RecF [Tepidanaerobacteraceae bacterium]|jgi:DNA replication and repair protein RecF|nr:DNA replication/repair protein RecF [Tepidanaerobacteraceae bacterium]